LLKKEDEAMTHVLIIDANHTESGSLLNIIQQKGYQASMVDNLPDAIQYSKNQGVDVVLMNSTMLKHKNGAVFQQLHTLSSAPEVIVMAENGSSEEAEDAINHGAWDYIIKSRSPQAIISSLAEVFKYRELLPQLQLQKQQEIKAPNIIGQSSMLKACLATLMKAAQGDANVLITGETGTGKELFATALHENSKRHKCNFVVVDCAALPETLVESALFGHEKGAFTGATQKQCGLIKQADGGTLFLDEVGELPLSLQKTFLRVLEERQFRMVGGKDEVKSNFRLVAATNQDLNAMVAKGTFRGDLLFRLRTFGIQLPPLRSRMSDIGSLVQFSVARYQKNNPACEKSVSKVYLKALSKYTWPGNVRELYHAVERSLAAAQQHSTLYPYHLPVYIRIAIAKASLPHSITVEESLPEQKGVLPLEEPTTIVHSINARQNLQKVREEVLRKTEEVYFRNLFSVTGGNIAQAIATSGLSRSRFYQLLKDNGLNPSALK
jgi:two-component system NtrC family response regulator